MSKPESLTVVVKSTADDVMFLPRALYPIARDMPADRVRLVLVGEGAGQVMMFRSRFYIDVVGDDFDPGAIEDGHPILELDAQCMPYAGAVRRLVEAAMTVDVAFCQGWTFGPTAIERLDDMGLNADDFLLADATRASFCPAYAYRSPRSYCHAEAGNLFKSAQLEEPRIYLPPGRVPAFV